MSLLSYPERCKVAERIKQAHERYWVIIPGYPLRLRHGWYTDFVKVQVYYYRRDGVRRCSDMKVTIRAVLTDEDNPLVKAVAALTRIMEIDAGDEIDGEKMRRAMGLLPPEAADRWQHIIYTAPEGTT